MEKIAAVVVTFNKKKLLVSAIKGILDQELLPHKLIIVDNNSNDGTLESALNNGWINNIPEESNDQDIICNNKITLKTGNEIEIDYIRKCKNDGGAGGFYRGMVHAYELGYEWLWMMDDDGVPDEKCLKYLYEHRDSNIVSGPLVIDIDSEKTASFIFDDINTNELVSIGKISKQEILPNVLTPFNGTFISQKVIKKIGYIKKEMFIWGDEVEYQSRILKNNFTIQTLTKAIHKHPVNKKNPIYKNRRLKFTIYDIGNPEFLYYFFRNYIYLQKKYPVNVKLGMNLTLIRLAYEACINSLYNLCTGQFYKSKLCLIAISKGIKGDFTTTHFK